MIVVSDTSPICYLLLIGEIELLPQLDGQVLIPQAVRQELADKRRSFALAFGIACYRASLDRSTARMVDDSNSQYSI